MYRDSIDALAQLVAEKWQNNEGADGDDYYCHIVKISVGINYLRNGIRYCSVQVTCDAGSEYLIQAFGDEAEELRRAANRYKRTLADAGIIAITA